MPGLSCVACTFNSFSVESSRDSGATLLELYRRPGETDSRLPFSAPD